MLKTGLIVLILGTTVAGCATPPKAPAELNGVCAIQPLGAQGGVLVAKVHCEAE